MSEFDFSHALAVAARVSSSDAKLVALLHDAVEDGLVSAEEISEIIDGSVLVAVLLLTRPDDLGYRDYIERLATAPVYAGYLARRVKRADLTVNLDRIDAAHASLEPRWREALERLNAVDGITA